MTTCIMKTGKKARNLNNKGTTLVELMVVIAVIVILLGAITFSVSLLFSRDAQQTASSIDNELSDARLMSMSKSGEYAYILDLDTPGIAIARYDYDSGTGLYSNESIVQNVQLRSDVDISIKTDGAADVTSGKFVVLFDKANGSVGKVAYGSLLTTAPTPVSSGIIYTIHIKARRGTQKESDVSLISTTGRHFMNGIVK